MPLTYSTMSGRLVFGPMTVTSSAKEKSLFPGFSQSITRTVTLCSPAPGRTFTP